MSDFLKRFNGRFESLLKWQDFDDFWQMLSDKNHQDWFIYAIGDILPTQPSDAIKTKNFLRKIAEFLHKEHSQDYCGIVYVNDKIDPKMIKIYDPNNLGVSCGFSDNPPKPGWIMTKIKPVKIEAELAIIPQKSQRFWQGIFG